MTFYSLSLLLRNQFFSFGNLYVYVKLTSNSVNIEAGKKAREIVLIRNMHALTYTFERDT